MMWARCVLPGGNDRKIDLLCTLFDDATSEVSRHLSFGPADEWDLAALEFTSNLVDSSTGSGKRVELRLVFTHAEVTNDVDCTRVLGSG